MKKVLVGAANSGNNSELVTQLQLLPAPPYANCVVYSLPLPDIQTGDVLGFDAQPIITCPQSYLCRAAIQAFICDNPTDLTGVELSEGWSENVDSDQAHHTPFRIGLSAWVADQAYIGKHLNIVMFGAATLAPASAPFDYLTVEQDYGQLSYLLFREEDSTPHPEFSISVVTPT
jgi:hypothetical protein